MALMVESVYVLLTVRFMKYCDKCSMGGGGTYVLGCVYIIFLSCDFRTPLMLATSSGHFECVKLLLNLGANVYAMDVYQRTALHRGVCI